MARFEIITADELIARLSKYNHKELHVHHTWRPNHANFNGSNHVKLQEGMRNYHVNNLGWADIGQHVTLMPDGKFVTGRDFGKTPASISGYNTGGFCVEMLGDFDIGKDKFEGAQKDAMLKLAKFFYDRDKYIRFHRENAPKTCPGTSIDKSVFMAEVKDYGKKVAAVIDDKRRFYLLTGTFANKAAAEEMAEMIRTNHRWIVHVIEDGSLFRLQTGTFSGKVAANEMAAMLRTKYRWLITVKEDV